MRGIFDRAMTEGFGERQFGDPEAAFYDELRRNDAVFSAFKVHRLQNDMAAQLLDAEGHLKSFAQWRRDIAPIASHQCDRWFRTEYATAVKRARLAADWKQYEADIDIFPNLRWLPSTAKHPGEDHRIFWNVVQPVHSPFWSQHRPGDRWGCQCGIEPTDDEATPPEQMPVPLDVDRPSPGLDNNPADDARLFSSSHPYLAHALPGARGAVDRVMEELWPQWLSDEEVRRLPVTREAYRERMKQIKAEALRTLRDRIFRNPEFEDDIRISKTGIGEFLNQPYRHGAYKNEMLLHIGEVLQKARYLGWVPVSENKRKRGVLRSHLFEIRVLGDRSWIIVHETKDGTMKLYSISDGEKVLEGVKKR